jgi:hypothetical protein
MYRTDQQCLPRGDDTLSTSSPGIEFRIPAYRTCQSRISSGQNPNLALQPEAYK